MKTRLGLTLVGGASALVAVLLLAEAKHPDIQLVNVERSEIAPGFELVQGALRRGRDTGKMIVVFVDPAAARFDIAFNPKRQELTEMAAQALVVANAGYFTKKWKPTGLLAARTKVFRRLETEGGGAGSGVMLVQANKASLLERSAAKSIDFTKAQLAIQAGPRIIEPGGRDGILSDDGARANRTVLGIDGRGRLALAVLHFSDGGFASGPTLFELMGLLGPSGLGKTDRKLAFDAALNLDGGPSTGIALRAPKPPIKLSAAGPVQHVLAISAKGATR